MSCPAFTIVLSRVHKDLFPIMLHLTRSVALSWKLDLVTTPGCLWPLFNLLQLFYQDNRTIHNPQSKTGTNGGICYLMAILYLAAPAHMRQVGDMFKFKQIFLHLEETSTTSDVDAGIENVRKVDANHANSQLRVVAYGGIHISNHA